MDSATIERWPELPYEPWKDTLATLHMWTQIVGKIRLVQMPWINHSWHTTLYVSPRGLTTSAMPHGENFGILVPILVPGFRTLECLKTNFLRF